MKINTLEINGLNSFSSPTKIDFRPLFKKGLFGIFGATGAGKSTILDAMFLSLYGKVLRSKNEFEFINTFTNKTSVTLNFDMLVNGVTKTYEVSREYSIDRKKKIVTRRAELYALSGNSKNLVAKGDKNVTTKIVEVIGFGEEEFARFIALPQGQFSKFIKDTAKNKIATIAKIFSLDKYGDQLNDSIREMLRENEQQKSYIQGILDQFENVSPKDLEKSEKQVEKLKKDIKSKVANYSALKKDLLEKERVLSLIEERDRLQERLDSLDYRNADYNRSKHDLAILKTSYTLAPQYQRINILTEEISSLKKRASELEGEIQAVNDDYLQAIAQNDEDKTRLMIKLSELERRHSSLLTARQNEERISGLTGRKNEMLASLGEAKAQLAILEQQKNESANILVRSCKLLDDLRKKSQEFEIEGNIITDARSYEALKSQIDIYNAMADVYNQKLASIKEEKNKIIGELVKDDADLTRLKQNLIKANQSLSELFDGEETAEGAIEKSVRTSTELQYMGNLYIENRKKINDLRSKVDGVDQKVTSLNNNLKRIEIDVNSINKTLSDLDYKYDDLIALREKNFGENLIGILKDEIITGQKCPVCEGVVLQAPSKVGTVGLRNIDDRISLVVSRQEDIRREKEGLIRKQTECSEQIKALIDSREIYINSLNELVGAQSRIEMAYPSLKNITEDSLETLVENSKDIVTKLLTLTDALNQIRDAVFSKERICVKKSALADELNNEENDTIHELSLIETNLADLNVKLVKYADLFSDRTIKDIKAFEDKKAEQDLVGLQQKEAIDKIIKDMAIKENATLKYQECLVNVKAIEREIASIHFELGEIEKQYNQIGVKGDTKTDLVNNLSNIESARADLANLGAREAELLKKETTLKLEKASITANLVIKSKELENVETEFVSMCNLAGISREELLKEVVYADIEVLEKKVGVYEAELDDASDDLRRINAMLAGKHTSKEEITQLTNALDNSEGEYIEISNKIAFLTEKIKNQKQAVGKLNEYKATFSKVSKKIDELNEIQKLTSGDKLLRYITEEYIFDITDKANKYFASLTSGRYQIVYKDDFIVIDNLNGGAPRSVGTLSGGETFLASLSMTIAIVESLAVIKAKPLDFVFLDEGFGTLDENSIEMVMNAIKNLRQNNFVFGLITHEEMVKDKINTRIEVYKDSCNSGSRIETIL